MPDAHSAHQKEAASTPSEGLPPPRLYLPFNHRDSAESIASALLTGIYPDGVGDVIQGIKANIPKAVPYYRGGDQEILKHFTIVRALSLHLYNFDFPRFSHDDRLADNFNLIFDRFEIYGRETNEQDPSRPQQFLSLLQSDLGPWAEFLMRTPSDLFKLLVYRLNIDSISDLQTLVKQTLVQPFSRSASGNGDHYPSQNLTDVLTDIPIEIVNLLIGMNQRSTVEQFAELIASNEGREVTHLLKEVPRQNISFLSESGGFTHITEARSYLSIDLTRANLPKCDLPRLATLATLTGIAPEERFNFVLNAISSFYRPSSEPYVKKLTEANLLASASRLLGPLIQHALQDSDYGNQNLHTISTLLTRGRLKVDSEVQELEHLMSRFNGFATPTLAERIFDAPERSDKEKLISHYQELQDKLLGSSPIPIDDPALIAEAIFLAYRPTNFDIPAIEKLIRERSVRDLSQHLDDIVVRAEGYPMRLRRMVRRQTAEFDDNILNSADQLLTRPYNQQTLVENNFMLSCLSTRPNDVAQRPMILAAIFQTLDDQRIKTYQDTYRSGKSSHSPFNDQRLESLIEILSVIPDEASFAQQIAKAIHSSEGIAAEIKEHAERFQWKQRKGRFSPPQIAEKLALEKLIHRLRSGGITPDAENLSGYSENLLSQELRKQLATMTSEQAADSLQARRNEFYLGIGPESSPSSYGIGVITKILREEARKVLSLLKREQKKIAHIASDEYDEVRAYISKNVGSFFAKAGAEICTASNFGMWNEARHFHLNVAHQNQIIWNNMLYFESSPELSPYLIARGINPRRDTMLMYERHSMAEEITRVLGQIAADNGKQHTYITQQTDFRPLSNRDGMAFEMTALSNRAQRRMQEIAPSVSVLINSPSFSYTTLGNHTSVANDTGIPLVLLTSSLITGTQVS